MKRMKVSAEVAAALRGELDVVEDLTCIRCSCTTARACPGGCAWASESPPVCTKCEEEVIF